MGSCITKNKTNRAHGRNSFRPVSQFEVLLLGTGCSGKSTYLKQLKNIYSNYDYMNESIEKTYRTLFIRDTMNSIFCLIRICEKMEYDMSEFESQIQVLKQWERNQTFTKEKADAIVKLWRSEKVQDALVKRTSFYVPDSAAYYMENVHRYTDLNFELTEEDLIRVKTPTTVPSVHFFSLSPITIRVMDLSADRREREKWSEECERADVIIYIANLMDYQNYLPEDEYQCSMQESLKYFEEVMELKSLRDIPIYLFLNKRELFEESVVRKDIRCFFPDYKGDFSAFSQMEFIKNEFRKKLRGCNESEKRLKLEGDFFISSCEKKDVKKSFEIVKDFLVEKYESFGK